MRGFTLIQVCILLTIASLLLVTLLPAFRAPLAKSAGTVVQLNTLYIALRQYEVATGTLPCPADASLPRTHAQFGVAATGTGSAKDCTALNAGDPRANYTDGTHHVAIGMLPVRTLGLEDNSAVDRFGRSITYAVDTHATGCWTANAFTGSIIVDDNGVPNATVAALISHGIDGHGAWLPRVSSGASAYRLNTSSSDIDQHLVNAHGLAGGGFPANYASINTQVTDSFGMPVMFSNKLPTATFDDEVIYRSPLWDIGTAPRMIQNSGAQITPPANAGYFTGQQLTFTLSFPMPVTVTGTPVLDLSVIGATGQVGNASYSSGSGTNVLIFTYTVASLDYAPKGISLASPMDMATGSLSPCVGFYTPPDLSKVTLNSAAIYVSSASFAGDAGIYKFNTDGTHPSLFSNYSNVISPASSTFPSFLAIGPDGALWVTDEGGSGTLLSCTSAGVCSNALASAYIKNAGGEIAFDAFGWLWTIKPNTIAPGTSVSNQYRPLGINYYQSINTNTSPPYSFSQTIGGNVWGVAVDSGNDVFVSDPNGNKLVKFNLTNWFNISNPTPNNYAWSNTGTLTGFTAPGGMAFDLNNNLWLIEPTQNHVKRCDAPTYASCPIIYGPSGAVVTVGFSVIGRMPSIDASGSLWVTNYSPGAVYKCATNAPYSCIALITSNGQSHFNPLAAVNGSLSASR